jgi:multidrug efflux pump subunit AcrA (membrane-fusion protein)
VIRKYLLPLLSIIGLGIAIAMAVQDNRTPAKTQAALAAATPPFSSYIFGPGIVEASSENIAIGTAVSGIVTAIYVKWGDRVRRSDALFKVDNRDLEAQLLPMAAKVKEMQAQLPAVTAKVNEAKANLEKVENRLKVGEGLEPSVSISVEDLANRRYDVGIDRAILASVEAQVEQAKTQVASTEAQVEQVKSQIASAKAQVDQIKAQNQLRAPLSGRI